MEDRKQAETQGAAKESGGSGPMGMGMGMAKKMMARMGQGGSPFEMMQKMMAQMGEGGDKPPMEKMMSMCMGICSEMLGAIEQTTAMAAFATPELRHAFGDWLKALEAKAEAALAEGEKDATALAATLGVDGESARYVFGRLAADGKVTLVARPRKG